MKYRFEDLPEFCGAKTRKGTPCKRRDIYGNGRCKLTRRTQHRTQDTRGQGLGRAQRLSSHEVHEPLEKLWFLQSPQDRRRCCRQKSCRVPRACEFFLAGLVDEFVGEAGVGGEGVGVGHSVTTPGARVLPGLFHRG